MLKKFITERRTLEVVMPTARIPTLTWFWISFLLIWIATKAVTANACGLCAGYNANVHVDLKVRVRGEYLVGLDVIWSYSDYLTGGMFGSFDPKGRPTPSAGEMVAAQKNIESNAVPNNYYFSAMINDKPTEINGFKNFKLILNENGKAIFTFNILLDGKLSEISNLKMWFLDPESYVNFFFAKERNWTQVEGGWEFTNRVAAGQLLTITPLRLAKGSPRTDLMEARQTKTVKPTVEPSPLLFAPARVKQAQRFPGISSEQPWWRTHLTLLRKALASLQRRLNTSFQQVKAGEGIGPFLFILMVSFMYGLLHAAGPGHGKTLMASYLAARPERFRVVTIMALSIGAVHIFTGVSVAVAVYFFLNVVLPKAISELSRYTTKIAGIMIVLVAVYLFYTKIRYGSLHSHGHNHHSSGDLHSFAGRQTNKFVVIGAGLMPCPGLVFVFLFCLALEMYWVGIFSAIAMSLGIATIQLITGSAVLAARKTLLSRVDKAAAVLEYGALALIFVLGLILFFFNPTLLTPLSKN